MAKNCSILILSLVFLLQCKEKDVRSSHHGGGEQAYSFHLNKLDVDKVDWSAKDLAYWERVLTPLQIKVCRKEGTERPFTGQYDKFYGEGVYVCSSCGQPLYGSKAKFDSKTGWPSFYEPITATAVKEKVDLKFGMKRVEVVCSRCNAHLGHVFKDGPPPTGLRHCINSVCLLFKKTK